MRKLLLFIIAFVALCISCSEHTITEEPPTGTRSEVDSQNRAQQGDTSGCVTITVDTAMAGTIDYTF